MLPCMRQSTPVVIASSRRNPSRQRPATANQRPRLDNPYQPPDDLNPGRPSKPDLAYWVHGYIGLRVFGVLLVAALTWYAETTAPKVPGLGWHMWVMLAWIVLGTLAAVGAAF